MSFPTVDWFVLKFGPDGALLWALRRLPASLWLMSGPEPLAMAEEVITLE